MFVSSGESAAGTLVQETTTTSDDQSVETIIRDLYADFHQGVNDGMFTFRKYTVIGNMIRDPQGESRFEVTDINPVLIAALFEEIIENHVQPLLNAIIGGGYIQSRSDESLTDHKLGAELTMRLLALIILIDIRLNDIQSEIQNVHMLDIKKQYMKEKLRPKLHKLTQGQIAPYPFIEDIVLNEPLLSNLPLYIREKLNKVVIILARSCR